MSGFEVFTSRCYGILFRFTIILRIVSTSNHIPLGGAPQAVAEIAEEVAEMVAEITEVVAEIAESVAGAIYSDRCKPLRTAVNHCAKHTQRA